MQDRRPGRHPAIFLVFALLASPALAQVIPQFGDLPLDAQALQQAQRQAAQRAALPTSISLEGAVDPDQYIVGPGDRFTITIGGNLAQELQTAVSADGHLLIAEVGRFRVASLTLTEVDRLVRPALQRIYRNVPAEIALTQPRQFYVHVSGAVAAPGRHRVGPIARAEDAVRAAMGDENPLRVLQQVERTVAATGTAQMYPGLRNVRVQHADGSSTSIDLRLYYTTGDRDQNPYLRDGDVLFVPAFDPFGAAVFVEGSVLSPGVYDLRPGDTVGSLLKVAAGDEALETLGPVRLVRADGGSETLMISASASAASKVLRPGDRLIVQAAAPELGTVAVEGRVMFPGEYPIRSGTTTVGELVAMAGGLREDALSNATYIERRGTTRPQLSGENDERSTTSRAMSSLEGALSQAELQLMLEDEAFRALRLADMDFTSRQYLLSELRRTPRIPLNLAGNPHSPDHAVALRDGDRLVIPEDAGGIYVFGQVSRSGFVPYTPGQDPDAYVLQAGGPTTAATDVFIRRAGSGHIVPAWDAGAVQPGDAIFVNRRAAADSEAMQQLTLQEQQLRMQQRQQWIQIGVAVLSTATAVVTALIFSR